MSSSLDSIAKRRITGHTSNCKESRGDIVQLSSSPQAEPAALAHCASARNRRFAALWTGFWFYAANRADLEITQWRTRESQNGRIFTCSRQDIGGYPFRLEVHCADPNAQLRSWQPPVGLAAKDSLVTVQVYDPTLVIGEFTGPLTIAEPGRPASMVANWTLAQASLRGRPSAPERLSVVLDNGKLAQGDGGTLTNVANAEHLELHGRLTGAGLPTTTGGRVGLRLTNGTAPVLQALSQRPTA